ncbi:hypothetical protein HUG10_21090 (plasmid) [Halorarum halophilum]|uniref:Uncharacterized protein n=1 Tax=Halorarum halophilum TaxID=2743090 RepID=A0A7D5GQ08_9EURY|nr:hypothetical protein [Halobaculum halophilum]QLG30084.1 hypothetical protein HUG10_21090 [Halobaculum halophilum]
MASSIDGIKNVLSLGRVRYIVVRPHRGMHDGYEVINAWNQDQMREFGPDQLDEAIEYAQDQAAYGTFDQVLAVFPPERKDEEEN